MPHRRTILAGLAGVPLVTPLMAARAQAAWPSRPIRIVVPFGLGGSADVAARFLAKPLSQTLGQPVIVENRPGGDAVIPSRRSAARTHPSLAPPSGSPDYFP